MLYRPRMLARLFVPLPDERGEYGGTSYDVPVIRASWTKNDPSHADELEIEVDYNDAGVDPRLLSGANVLFYLGNADEFGAWEPIDDEDVYGDGENPNSNLRFAGRLITPERVQRPDGLRVTLKFVDYTSYFLVAKPVSVDALPLYSDTLSEAWRRLCENVPGADAFAESIEFRGAADVLIGGAVASRFAQTSTHVPVKPDDDAWAIWANTCGMLGLITFFDVDRLVVTSELDFFTVGDPPRLLWGRDIEEIEEHRNEDFANVGIIIQSFDPQKGAIEAMWPPSGAPELQKRAYVPKARKKAESQAKEAARAQARLVAAEQRVAFVYPNTTDPAKLLEIAKQAYAVRSRQAIDGRLVTVEMFVPRASGRAFDLLSLSSGDTIEIRLLDDEAGSGDVYATPAERIAYLVSQGCSEQVAKIITANGDTLGRAASLFYVKAVQVDFDNSGEGSFKVSIDFINKIDVGAMDPG